MQVPEPAILLLGRPREQWKYCYTHVPDTLAQYSHSKAVGVRMPPFHGRGRGRRGKAALIGSFRAPQARAAGPLACQSTAGLKRRGHKEQGRKAAHVMVAVKQPGIQYLSGLHSQ